MMQKTDPLIEDEKAQAVFSAVARDRRVTFRQLVKELSIDRDEVQEKLQTLKKAELVKEKVSSIEDLNTYYLTSKGFSADRSLKRLGAKLRPFS